MSETKISDAISEMTQDQLRDRIAYEYVIKKAPTKEQYQELYGDMSLDILLQNIRSTIDSVMEKYGNPYINVKGTSGRASYSAAGKVRAEVPFYFHHQGDERLNISKKVSNRDFIFTPTMDPDTLNVYSDSLYNDWLAEMGHAMQYRHPRLPFNNPYSAFVRDSLKQERIQQLDKYGDMGDHVERGGGEGHGHYGVSHQKDKGLYIDEFTTFGDYVSENPLAFLFNPIKGFSDYFAGKKAEPIPTVESQAHSENEWKLEREIMDIIKSKGEVNLND